MRPTRGNQDPDLQRWFIEAEADTHEPGLIVLDGVMPWASKTPTGNWGLDGSEILNLATADAPYLEALKERVDLWTELTTADSDDECLLRGPRRTARVRRVGAIYTQKPPTEVQAGPVTIEDCVLNGGQGTGAARRAGWRGLLVAASAAVRGPSERRGRPAGHRDAAYSRRRG
jgi:hypothetical protein